MIRALYITWRKKVGERRYIIAKIKRNVSEGISFEYLPDYEKAKNDGLEHFFGFKEPKKLSPNDIEEILSLRVISKERPDRNEFLKFWEADEVNDIMDILALTQGKSPTDNFEFLANYLTVNKKHLIFITDLAGLSHLKLPIGTVKKGDILSFQREPRNPKDENAIAVYNGSTKVGYIKKIHNKIFQKRQNLKLIVKAIDENGYIKQIFVKVSCVS